MLRINMEPEKTVRDAVSMSINLCPLNPIPRAHTRFRVQGSGFRVQGLGISSNLRLNNGPQFEYVLPLSIRNLGPPTREKALAQYASTPVAHLKPTLKRNNPLLLQTLPAILQPRMAGPETP